MIKPLGLKAPSGHESLEQRIRGVARASAWLVELIDATDNPRVVMSDFINAMGWLALGADLAVTGGIAGFLAVSA